MWRCYFIPNMTSIPCKLGMTPPWSLLSVKVNNSFMGNSSSKIFSMCFITNGFIFSVGKIVSDLNISQVPPTRWTSTPLPRVLWRYALAPLSITLSPLSALSSLTVRCLLFVVVHHLPHDGASAAMRFQPPPTTVQQLSLHWNIYKLRPLWK